MRHPTGAREALVTPARRGYGRPHSPFAPVSTTRPPMHELILEIWERIRPHLRRRLGDRPYRSWIEPLSIQRLQSGVLYLGAPSRWIADHANRVYGQTLGDVVGRELGASVQVLVQETRSGSTAALDRNLPDLALDPASGFTPILDEGNREAWLVLESVALGKGREWNPLVLFGGSGVGKTTLLKLFIRRSQQPMRYFLATDFHEEFAAAARKRDLAAFRTSFAGAPGLVLDEFHRMKGKVRAQHEMALLLGSLVERGRPVVIGSRHHPKEVHRMDPYLATRLLSGFVAELKAPRWEARMQFLRRLEGQGGATLPDVAVVCLADLYRGGYSGLKEAWLRLRGRMHGQPAVRGTQLRTVVLQCFDPGSDPLELILKKVAQRFGLVAEEIAAGGQHRRLTCARQLVLYLAVRRGLHATEVGKRIGGRTRAAVSYACREVERRLKDDRELAQLVEEIS
jgi:chromosomal replication initiator protein